jgi:hypothetical protein
VDPPRILLVPGFTELTWTIKPLLEKWAEVASYDPPGVGDEPRGDLGYEAVAERGLQELDKRGWSSYFVAVDGVAAPIAIHIAMARREDVLGLALGHAALSTRRSGERPPISPEIHSAMTQLLKQDREGFLRNAIVQATGGSYDEELAQEIVDRMPLDVAEEAYKALTEEVEFDKQLQHLDVPLLLVKHEGCLMHTDEGYADAVVAFPGAMTASTPDACCTDPGFAEALREFCESVTAAEQR